MIIKKDKKQYQKEWRNKNRQKVRESNKEWKSNNKNKIKITYKRWYLKNREDILEKDKINNNEYRFGGLRDKVLERDNWRCLECGMNQEQHIILFGRSLTIDHIDGNGRYSDNPNNNIENLQTLCLRCHGKKDIRRKE